MAERGGVFEAGITVIRDVKVSCCIILLRSPNARVVVKSTATFLLLFLSAILLGKLLWLFCQCCV